MTSTERDFPEHASRDEDHKRIWLSPACDDERTWCQDDQGPCDECGAPSVEYVRADALASIRAELAEALADKARVDELLTAAVDDYDAAWKALKPFAAIGNDMFIDPENGWSDTDVLSIEADPDYGVFAHLKAGDFRAARAIAGEQTNDA